MELIKQVVSASLEELRGLRGEQGPPGQKGDRGEVGPLGERGPIGPQGLPGEGFDPDTIVSSIKVRRLEVVSLDGVSRAILDTLPGGTAELRFLNPEGVELAAIGQSLDSWGRLDLRNNFSNSRVSLSVIFNPTLELRTETDQLTLQGDTSFLSHDIVVIRSGGEAQSSVVKDLRKTIVRINSSGGNLIGSGVLISENEILTAYHNIEGKVGIPVIIDGVGSRIATVTGYDSARDLALLSLTDSASGQLTLADFAESLPVPGDSIAVIGFSNASETHPTVTFGHVTGRIHWVDIDSTEISIDAIINPGSSGGAVFDDIGNLVAMIRAKSLMADGVGYAIEVDQIRKSLEDLRRGMKR